MSEVRLTFGHDIALEIYPDTTTHHLSPSEAVDLALALLACAKRATTTDEEQRRIRELLEDCG